MTSIFVIADKASIRKSEQGYEHNEALKVTGTNGMISQHKASKMKRVNILLTEMLPHCSFFQEPMTEELIKGQATHCKNEKFQIGKL